LSLEHILEWGQDESAWLAGMTTMYTTDMDFIGCIMPYGTAFNYATVEVSHSVEITINGEAVDGSNVIDVGDIITNDVLDAVDEIVAESNES